MAGVIDFSVYNLDSIFWSVLLGVVGCFLLWRAAKAANKIPSGMTWPQYWSQCNTALKERGY